MSNEGNESRTPRRRARMVAALAVVFAVGAASGGAVMTATDAWSHGSRWGGTKGHHGDPERWKEHMLDRADGLLDRIDATGDQREAISAIIGQAADDFAGAFGEHRSLHGEWLAELERPELDADAMETLRARHVELVDGKSRQALDVVLRIGSVLSAEQRSELVAKLSRFREGRRERHGRSGS